MFLLYVNCMGDSVFDSRTEGIGTLDVTGKSGNRERVTELDILPTRMTDGSMAIAVVNKNPSEARELAVEPGEPMREYRIITVNGDGTDAYNDVDTTGVTLTEGQWRPWQPGAPIRLEPHSVNVVQLRW